MPPPPSLLLLEPPSTGLCVTFPCLCTTAPLCPYPTTRLMSCGMTLLLYVYPTSSFPSSAIVDAASCSHNPLATSEHDPIESVLL